MLQNFNDAADFTPISSSENKHTGAKSESGRIYGSIVDGQLTIKASQKWLSDKDQQKSDRLPLISVDAMRQLPADTIVGGVIALSQDAFASNHALFSLIMTAQSATANHPEYVPIVQAVVDGFLQAQDHYWLPCNNIRSFPHFKSNYQLQRRQEKIITPTQ